MMTTCPHCGKDLHAPASNCALDLPLQIPEAMIPGLIDALSIGRNTAFISREPENQRGLEALIALVEAALPPLAKNLRSGQYAALSERIAKGHLITFEIGTSGKWYETDFHVRMIDTTGESWAKPATGEPAVMKTQKVASREEAEDLKRQLEDLRERFTPL